MAATIFSGVETAVLMGGLSAIGAALYSIGVPKDSVLQYETALTADAFLVTAHGSAADLARARTILAAADPSSLELHPGAPAPALVTLR